jgi:hypothetical protein
MGDGDEDGGAMELEAGPTASCRSKGGTAMGEPRREMVMEGRRGSLAAAGEERAWNPMARRGLVEPKQGPGARAPETEQGAKRVRAREGGTY